MTIGSLDIYPQTRDIHSFSGTLSVEKGETVPHLWLFLPSETLHSLKKVKY